MKYNLNNLDSRAFESLCADIVEKEQNCRVEVFSIGTDGGIDGRFWFKRKKGIIQAKHYPTASSATLIRNLKNEVKKVDKLKPSKYLVFTSGRVSVSAKNKIRQLFHPYIKNESDIWGIDDIQRFLSKKNNFDIVKKYTQIYIDSADMLIEVLGPAIKNTFLSGVNTRSEFIYKDIKKYAKKLVITKDYINARTKLTDNHALIITGEAGIGKTKLSNLLAFDHIKEGYDFFDIKNVEEAELILADLNNTKKVFLYYDDFLGENLSQVLGGNKASQIMLLLDRVKRLKNVRFLLNSRTTILNNAISTYPSFANKNILDETYLININGLTLIDKALILYKHMYFSDLSSDYVDQIYNDKNYHKIIQHKNFSPRIIDFILDKKRISDIKVSNDEYFNHIIKSLDYPADIWSDYFDQLELCTQKLILLVTANEGNITEDDLKRAYNEYINTNGFEQSSNSSYSHVLRVATNALVNRSLKSNDVYNFTLFNPSVGDYIIKTYFVGDEFELYRLLSSLQSLSSLRYLVSLEANKFINMKMLLSIQKRVFSSLVERKIKENDFEWLLYIIKISHENLDSKDVEKVLKLFVENYRDSSKQFYEGAFYDAYHILQEYQAVLEFKEFEFLSNFIHPKMDNFDFDSLFRFIENHDVQNEEVLETLTQRYIDYVLKNIDDYLDIDYKSYVYIERDGSIHVDDMGIKDELNDCIDDNFFGRYYAKDFLEKRNISSEDIVRDIYDEYSQKVQELYENSLLDDRDFSSLDQQDLISSSFNSTRDEIDEIFKR